MQRLSRSLSAEFRKLVATHMWWIMTVVMFVYSAMMGAVMGAVGGTLISDLPPGIDGPDAESIAAMTYATSANLAYAVPVLFGAIMATGELRHRTLALAFLAEPKRGIVLLGKLIALLLVGLMLAVAGLAGSVGVGAITLNLVGSSSELDSTDVWAVIARAIVVLALWAIIGFGIGLLVRNQAIAIVIVLVFTQFIEPTARLLGMVWEWTAKVVQYLPGAASDAFVGASYLTSMGGLDPSVSASNVSLGIWAGFGVVMLYGALAVGFGYVTRWRGDID